MPSQSERPRNARLGPALNRIVRGMVREWRGKIDQDLVEDCLVEAELAVWRAASKLDRVPLEQQPAYLAACVRHAVAACRIRETRQPSEAIPLEELPSARLAGPGTPGGIRPDDPIRDLPLVEQVADPRLADGLRNLSPDDSQILDLFYAGSLDDAAIGQRLNLTRAAAKKRRQRLIARPCAA